MDSRLPLDRHQLWRVIQQMVDAVVVFEPQGTILICNASFERLIGRPQDELMGQSMYELFERISPDLSKKLQSFSSQEEAFTYELTLAFPPPMRILNLTVVPIEEAGQVAEAVGVFHDVTDVKQTEKMRRDFVANVSHELRTPLSAIQGYAETLLEGALDDQAVARDFVQIVYNHASRLSLLVQDLLDLSKLESPDFQVELGPVDLITTIQNVVKLHQSLLQEKQISMSLSLSETPLWVLAHEGNLEQVMTNLLDNAIKYTPAGGGISIETTVLSPQEIQVNLKDNGMGIDPKHIPRLFERFYRVDKARSRDLGGTGLGLSIVKHIIQYHGGRIWVESSPGKGSIFSFTLQPIV